jgi:hypothetical protein
MEETGNTLAEGTMIFLASGESGHLQQTSNGIAFAQRLRKQFVAIQFAYLSNNWNGLQPINGVIRRIRKSVARPRNPTVLYNGTRSSQQAPGSRQEKTSGDRRPAVNEHDRTTAFSGLVSQTQPNPPKPANVENLSSLAPQNRSNDPSFHTTSALIPSKIFGRFLGWTWYSDNRGQRNNSPLCSSESGEV